AHERAGDEDLGVGEVDELEHAVDHRVAERDQGVHEAEDEAVEDDLGEDADQELEIQGSTRRLSGGLGRGDGVRPRLRPEDEPPGAWRAGSASRRLPVDHARDWTRATTSSAPGPGSSAA